MRVFSIKNIFFVVISFSLVSFSYADNLGRIFTSAEERQKLEKIRQIKEAPKKFVIEEVKKTEEPVAVKKEIVIRDSITLKGLVYRSGGKSTAWLNESNAIDGDLGSQLIQVPDNEIKADQVTINMSDDNTQVELKVGEVFTPPPIERDAIETSRH